MNNPITRFFNWFLQLFRKDEDVIDTSEEEVEDIDVVSLDIEEPVQKIDKRSNLTKIYHLKQEIEVFMNSFPERYKYYLGILEGYEKMYHENLEKFETEVLTLVAHPEDDCCLIADLEKLKREIDVFINGEVKAKEKLERICALIGKSNILYNASIKHPKSEDKLKVMKQLEHIIASEDSIINDLGKIFSLKKIEILFSIEGSNLDIDKILEFIIYEEYYIFKLRLRNSDSIPEEAISKMLILQYFPKFDVVSHFKAFLEDELSDLNEIIKLINSESEIHILEQKYHSIYRDLINKSNFEDLLLDEQFWKKYFSLESNVINFLRSAGVEARVEVLEKYKSDIEVSNLLTQPKDNAFISAISLWHETNDEKIFIFTKFVERMPNNITYRDIYFLAVLFGVLDILICSNNNLTPYMNKYNIKYQYTQAKLENKKKQVFDSSKSKYALCFECEDSKQLNLITKTLVHLSLDFKVLQDNVYLNIVYFIGLNNILNSFTQYLQ